MKVLLPWGYYEDIYRSAGMVMKKIIVHPNHRLSSQYHEKRCEYWGVESGEGKLTLGEVDSIIFPTNSVYIPIRKIHRVENIGTIDLVIYETQIGICDEKDIVRLSDDYGR